MLLKHFFPIFSLVSYIHTSYSHGHTHVMIIIPIYIECPPSLLSSFKITDTIAVTKNRKIKMWLFAGLMIFFVLIIIILLFLTRFISAKAEINNFDKRYVFITGCDTGFGNLLARTLDAKGLHVIAGCLTESGQKGLKAVTSARLKTVHIDVTDKDSITAAYEFTIKNIGNEGKKIIRKK